MPTFANKEEATILKNIVKQHLTPNPYYIDEGNFASI
jgi:hypothetical protein